MFGIDVNLLGAGSNHDVVSKGSHRRRVSPRLSSRASSKGSKYKDCTSLNTARSNLATQKIKPEIVQKQHGKFEVLVMQPAKKQLQE